MIHADFNLVLKYCEVLDEFIKIRVYSEEEAREIIKTASQGDKAGFQRKIIKSCIADYNENVLPRLDNIDENPAAIDIEEMLYLLCVEVNPGLDIHQVSVQVGSHEVEVDNDPALAKMLKQSTQRNLSRISDMENEIRKRVIGQDKAVDIVSRSIKKSVVGLRDPEKPVGAYLFVGQVGVGKTELAKALSDYLYGSQSRLIRVDCSEYALPHEYAKLIGSPPGYIGHNEGGYLTEAAKELGEFIVLFDEIEKAHSKMHNILLQLLDEGVVTDSKGFKVSFRNALVLMTSNLGVSEANEARGGIGFDVATKDETRYEDMQDTIFGALKKAFRPEFINRLDDVIVFNTLTFQDSLRIVNRMMTELARIAKRAGLGITATPECKHLVAEAGFKPECGARELKRTIKKMIEEPLTEMLLANEIAEGDFITLDARDGALKFDVITNESLAALPE